MIASPLPDSARPASPGRVESGRGFAPAPSPPPPAFPEAPSPPKVLEVIEVSAFPKAPKPEVIEIIEVPPAPPAPKSPMEHVKEMAEKGAKFYFNDEAISSSQAIKLVSTKKKLRLVTNHTNDSDYEVHLYSKPVVIEQD